jgi:hypothetical protein
VADSPLGSRRWSTRSLVAGYLLCSLRVLPSFLFDPFVPVILVAEVRLTVRKECAEGPPGADSLQVVGGWSVFSGALLEVWEPILDSPPCALRKVRLVPAESLPPPYGRSAQATGDCLSPLLLELRFHVALSLGLFLGLVGPL